MVNVLIENGQFKIRHLALVWNLGCGSSNFHSSGTSTGGLTTLILGLAGYNGTGASGNGTLSFIAGVHSFEDEFHSHEH
jgi:hypothetical protein